VKTLTDFIAETRHVIMKSGYKVFLQGPLYEETTLMSEMGYYLHQEIKSILKQSSTFHLVEKVTRYEMVSTYLSMADDVFQVDGILCFRLKSKISGLQLQMNLIDINTLETFYKNQIRISSDLLPSLSIIPSDFFPLTKFMSYHIQEKDLQQLPFTCIPSRGFHSHYRKGENWKSYYRGKEDLYIKVCLIQPDGKMYLLFPNQRQVDNLVESWKLFSFPEESGYVLPEEGTYTVLIFFQKQPFEDYLETPSKAEQIFLFLGNAFQEKTLWEVYGNSENQRWQFGFSVLP